MKRCFSCFECYNEELSVCPHCGQIEITKPVVPVHLYPGTILADRYILGTAVGAGGFGIVYKAWDSKLETIVAVKEFFVSRLITRAEGLKDIIVSRKSQEEFEYRKVRFLAEARNMAKFGAHRNIPNVFEFFEENNTAYIVMEYLRGVTLNKFIEQNDGKIDIDTAIVISNEISNALKSLHDKNIIHRDVAPDNIFICAGDEMRVKLMDLGAAKLADSTDDVIDIILKPGYSPTEQYDNTKNIGPSTDIYALGATLYMMLTGVKPDEATNRGIPDTVVSPEQLNPQISENLSNTIMKAMAKEMHMRFKNIPEFQKALNGEKKVVTLEKEKKRRKFRRFSEILSACLIIAVVSGIVLFSYGSKKAAQYLDEASISIWFSVADGSTEAEAMQSVVDDFTSKFDKVTVDLQAIPESEYMAALSDAAAQGNLPTLFESTGVDESILDQAHDISNILESEQAAQCHFINQYNSYYSQQKQIPLAIEVPVAYIVTSGAAALDYEGDYFSSVSDFGSDVNVAADNRYPELVNSNFGDENFSSQEEFLNNESNTSPVLLSSTMILNEVRTTLVNYEKSCVYYDADTINCRFTYEWSIGNGEKDEIIAAERLLTWMLGNVYQSTLMINKCSDGQIPINTNSFDSKIQTRNLAPIGEIYYKFMFEKEW